MDCSAKNDSSFFPEISKFKAILSLDPNSVVFAPLAEAYRRAGMFDDAIRVAKEGLKRHPKYPSGMMALGRAYFEKGMLSEAKDVLEGLVAIAPDNIIAINILKEIKGRIVLQPKKEVAVSAEEREEARPKKEITTETIADLYIKQGYIDRAIDIYETLYAAHPENDEIGKKLEELKRRFGWTGKETGRQVRAKREQEEAILEQEDLWVPAVEEAKGVSGDDDPVKRLEAWLDVIQKERRKVA